MSNISMPLIFICNSKTAWFGKEELIWNLWLYKRLLKKIKADV